MITSPQVRRATPDDRQIIAEQNRAMASESEGKSLDADLLQRGVGAVFDDSNKGAYYLAMVEEAVAGQLMITREWSDWRNGWFWWIQSVYVQPRFRRRGVFRALYEHVRALAISDPTVCGIRLYVEKRNDGAWEVYRKVGMIDAGYRLMEEDWSAKRR